LADISSFIRLCIFLLALFGIGIGSLKYVPAKNLGWVVEYFTRLPVRESESNTQLEIIVLQHMQELIRHDLCMLKDLKVASRFERLRISETIKGIS
jgi:hypothetical protein